MNLLKRFTLTLACAALSACALTPGEAPEIVRAAHRHSVTVQTASGPITGVQSDYGEAFLGVPYAAPPLENLRWRPPQPVSPWIKPLVAAHLGHECVQNLSAGALNGKGGGVALIRGSEDCLTLNVYAPSNAMAAERRPVMVFIHGGAFVVGSGPQYDPSLMAQKNGVLVVTFN